MPNEEELQIDALDLEEELDSDSSKDLDLESELDIDALDLLDEEESNGPIDTYQSIYTVAPLVILAAGGIIRPEASVMNITATVGGGAVTLTSNPSIADGINGQQLILRGSSATDTITITDGNGVQLNGNVTLGLNDTITLYYDGLITNDWIELTRSLNGTQIGVLASGVYTPTASSATNLDSTPTMSEAQYMRVGSVVTVSGSFTANPTTTATATNFEITLPIASNIGAVEDVAGVAFTGTAISEGAEIDGVAANDTAQFEWLATDVSSRTWSYIFTYQII